MSVRSLQVSRIAPGIALAGLLSAGLLLPGSTGADGTRGAPRPGPVRLGSGPAADAGKDAARAADGEQGAEPADEREIGGGRDDFLPPEACRPCHPRHYEEWRGSMHAYSITDPVFFAMNAFGQEDTGGALGDFCIRCHAPVGTLTGEVTPGIEGSEGLSRIAGSGVSCEVCHRDVRLDASDHPANASFEIAPGGPMVGGLEDPVPNRYHASRTDDTIRRAEFCGSCHDVVNDRGVPVEKPYAEHVASPYPGRGVSCVTCHMPTYTGRATPDGPVRRELHRHDFVGVDVALTPFPRRGFQRREVERFLRTAAELSLEAPERAVPGEPFAFTVRVRNAGAGHNLPTGPSTERQMWVEVVLRTADGLTVFRSGQRTDDGELAGRHHPGDDPSLALFSDRFVDEEGREVPFMWQAHRLEEGTIPPLTTRSLRYEAPWPAGLEADALELEVRLLFRAFPPHQLDRLGIGDLRDRFPVFVMAEQKTGRLPVVATQRREGTIRVPEDAPHPAAALAEARDGDTVLVGPGRWTLDGPLDFGGRGIALRAREGPERTVLELAGEIAEPGAASLVRFVSGESARARLEGFTLRGGRGTLLDGERRGGAVLVRGSDPTIASCVFVENRAAGSTEGPPRQGTRGRGGAVFLEDSFAHVRDCRFTRNVAGGEGGAVCIAGRSGVLLERSEVLDNEAREGGGVHAASGNVLLDLRVLRNRAFRGGGLHLTASAGAATRVQGGLLAANSAREGGGMLAGGRGVVRVERAVLAGNLGGGLAVRDGASVLARIITLVDHRYGPATSVAEGASLAVRGSVLRGNRPPELEGDIRGSSVDDPRHLAGGRGNVDAAALFRSPAARWERCQGPQEDCVPAVRESLRPESPRYWRRYVPGSYVPGSGSPLIDAGSAAEPPDPDGTRADLGARHVEQPRRLFVRGDLDGDGRAGPADLGPLVEALRGGKTLPCAEAGDLDDDGRLAPPDAVRLLDFLLHRGPPPAAPWPRCGPDPRPGPVSPGCQESRCAPFAAGPQEPPGGRRPASEG